MFYVTLPFAGAALAGTAAFISETINDTERKLDWLGFVTRYRTEGLGFLYLLFYFGSAIGGGAAVFAFQAKHIQINRAALVENMTPFNETLRLPGGWDLGLYPNFGHSYLARTIITRCQR